MRNCDTCGRPLRGGTCWRCDGDGVAAVEPERETKASTRAWPGLTLALLAATGLLAAAAIGRISTLSAVIDALVAWNGDESDLWGVGGRNEEGTSSAVLLLICIVVALVLFWSRARPAGFDITHRWPSAVLGSGLSGLGVVLLTGITSTEPQRPVPSMDQIVADALAGRKMPTASPKSSPGTAMLCSAGPIAASSSVGSLSRPAYW